MAVGAVTWFVVEFRRYWTIHTLAREPQQILPGTGDTTAQQSALTSCNTAASSTSTDYGGWVFEKFSGFDASCARPTYSILNLRCLNTASAYTATGAVGTFTFKARVHFATIMKALARGIISAGDVDIAFLLQLQYSVVVVAAAYQVTGGRFRCGHHHRTTEAQGRTGKGRVAGVPNR